MSADGCISDQYRVAGRGKCTASNAHEPWSGASNRSSVAATAVISSPLYVCPASWTASCGQDDSFVRAPSTPLDPLDGLVYRYTDIRPLLSSATTTFACAV